MKNIFSIIFQIVIQTYTVLVPISLYLCNFLTFTNVICLLLSYCIYCQFTSYTEIRYSNKSLVITNMLAKSKLKEFKYRPHFFIPSTLLQTVLMPMIGYHDIFDTKREEINPYGTHIDWMEVSQKNTFQYNERVFSNKRILIILPGITGGATEPYISNIAYEAVKNNYKVAIFQNRLLSTSLSFTYKGFFDLVDDFKETLDFIEKNYPEYDLYAVGNSLGAMGLLRFLGQFNTISKGVYRIKGAVSLSNPFDMHKCEKVFSNTLYETLLTYILHKKMDIVNHPNLVIPKELNLDLVGARHCTTVREFNSKLIMRIQGYKDVDKFYNSQKCTPYIKKIKVPTLIMNSVDDQIAHKYVFPHEEIKENKNIVFMLTKYGGHLCWIDNSSLFNLHQWPMKVAFEFLNNI